MRKVTDFNEFISLWNISHKNRYWGNKKISIEQEQEIIKKADVSDYKRYNIYLLEDNYHFIVVDTKWHISSNLYYDDEMDAPEVTLEYFKRENQINVSYYELEKNELIKPYFILNYNGNDREVCIQRHLHYDRYLSDVKWAKDKNIYYREMSDEEIKQYNEIVRELIKKYDERLEKYFKKYRDKIYAIGYWVNR